MTTTADDFGPLQEGDAVTPDARAESDSAAELNAAHHLVIIVPGIRDRGGDWGVVRDELRAAGFSAMVVTWNEFFGLPRFLVPAPWFRRKAMRSLEGRIWDAIKAHTVERRAPKVSFIAHSFGSYILCYLLRRQHLFDVHRIIICGSVLPRSFPFSSFATRFKGPIVNDVGRQDRWPFVASCVTFGYGTIGTYGYQNAPVQDRFHEGVGHDGFTKPDFTTRWWIPALWSSNAIESPTPNIPIKEGPVRTTVNSILQNVKWVAVLFVSASSFYFFVPAWLPCSIQTSLGLPRTNCSVDLTSITRGVKIGQCNADTKASSVQPFEKGWLLYRPSTSMMYAISRTDDTKVRWKKKLDKSESVNDTCVDVRGTEKLQWGFRHWYCSDPALRVELGEPTASEDTTWVQFQDWQGGLLIVSLPWRAASFQERRRYFEMHAVFLEHDGSGSVLPFNYRSFDGKAWCTSLWWSAFKSSEGNNKSSEENYAKLVEESGCSSFVHPKRYTAGRNDCSVSGQ